MHRHPLRDNMLHTIAMQIMALHVHTKAEQRPCRAASLSACRPTRTYTHAQTHMHKHTCTQSVLFSVLLCILSFSGSLLLCQGPNNTPHSTQTQAPPLFACLEFSFWLRGPGQGTKHTSQHLMVAQTPSSVHIHTLLLLCTYATLDGCLQNSPVLKVTPGFLWGPAYSGRLSDNTHYREERKEKKTLVLYMLVSDFKI